MSTIQHSYVNKDGKPPGGAEACACELHALKTTYWGKGHLLFDIYPLDHSKLQHHSETKLLL